MKKILKNRGALAGLILITIVMLCALLAGVLAPNDPMRIDMDSRFAAPGVAFPLGADALGRCVLSRLLYGARTSLGLGVLVMAGIAVTAIPLAMAATFRGGVVERAFQWLCDISMALPPTVLVLAVTGILGNGLWNLVFSTLFAYWGWYGRMVRSYTAVELGKGYVAYAITGGAPAASVLATGVLPNILPSLLILFCLGVGDTILTVSGFSFLGIGLPAGVPEWGAMLGEARSLLLQAPQYALYPGLCVVLTVIAFNLFAEGTRKALSITGKGTDYA